MKGYSIEEYTKWLNSLKAGDEVIMERHFLASHPEYSVTKISIITPKRGMRVGLSAKMLFKEGRHHESDGKWSSVSYRLLPVTDEIMAEKKRQKQLMNIKTVQAQVWDKLTAEQTNGIHTILFGSGQ